MNRSLRVGSLFAGIGGLDLGFERSGHRISFYCENDPSAAAVLTRHFPDTKLFGDIQQLKSIPEVDVLTAGFPCQDISLAGTRHGLLGKRSGLVNEVFRLLEKSKTEYLVLENVLNLLRLEKGRALVSILKDLELLGYNWAYRVIDSRGFGLPQRRMRVVILATRARNEAANILFSDAVMPSFNDEMRHLKRDSNYGFYWTEGKRGVGWAVDAVPTIKGGSGIGIPSPPAIFSGLRRVAGTIHIEDAEILQGFPAGWTDVEGVGKIGARWRLVGNAVSVPLSDWLGRRFVESRGDERSVEGVEVAPSAPLPHAAFGRDGKWFEVKTSTHVLTGEHLPIGSYLRRPIKPLSERALAGYLSRAHEGDKRFPVGFLKALEVQLQRERKKPIEEFNLV